MQLPAFIHSTQDRDSAPVPGRVVAVARALNFGAMESGSETDESEHPLPPPGSSRDGSLLSSAAPAALAEALCGAGVAAVRCISAAKAAAAALACASLRDDAGISYMFAAPDSKRASPCAAEALWLDDGALASCPRPGGAAALRAALADIERVARSAAVALGHEADRLVWLGVPMASVGEGELRERFHGGADGAPFGAGGRLVLTVIVTLDDSGEVSVLPPSASAAPTAAKRRKREAAAALRFPAAAGRALLLSPSAARASAGAGIRLVTWWALAEPPAPAPAPSPAAVRVFDGVLAEADVARLAASPPVRWAVFDRRCEARNVLERAIEALLSELGDDARYVEYWGRARWDSVPAHRDCDEATLSGGVQRYPVYAHVLYLEVAPEVAAPTLLWVPGATPSLRVVQATPARLLRFAGDLLHGVPRPACEYIGEDEAAADSDDEGGVEEEEGGEEEGEEEAEEEEEEEGSREKRATPTPLGPPSCATSFSATPGTRRRGRSPRTMPSTRPARRAPSRRAPTSCACVASRSPCGASATGRQRPLRRRRQLRPWSPG